MRIFLVLHPSGNLAVPGSMTWYKNFYEPLIDLGHDVFLLRLDTLTAQCNLKFRTPRFKEKLNRVLQDTFAREHARGKFDLFLSYLTDLDVDAGIIDEIKKHDLPTANFSCNNTHQFHLVGKISPHYDFNLHAEKDAAGKFRQIGAKPVWFQMAANPTHYHPMTVARDYPVTFTGSNYARRAYYILHLLQQGVPVDCFGPNWPAPGLLKKTRWQIKRTVNLLRTFTPAAEQRKNYFRAKIKEFGFQQKLRRQFGRHLHPPVAESELSKIFNRSEINLGFLEVFDEGANLSSSMVRQHLHLREFEIPMSGGLYLTNYSDELAEHYEPDREVLVFHDESELLEKVRFYLAHPQQADQVREAGLKRALNDHTYQKRFKTLFIQLGLT